MHPGQHPQQTDEGGDGQHPDADGGVEVEPHHPKDGGAQSVAGGAGIAAGALRDEGDKARLLIRAGKVESGPQEGAHPERPCTLPRTSSSHYPILSEGIKKVRPPQRETH